MRGRYALRIELGYVLDMFYGFSFCFGDILDAGCDFVRKNGAIFLLFGPN